MWDLFASRMRSFRHDPAFQFASLQLIMSLDEDRGGKMTTRHSTPAQSDRTILALLTRYGKGQCYDIRDRIFGLHGVASDPERIEVDYRRSPAEIFCLLVNHGGWCRDWREAHVAWSALQLHRLLSDNDIIRFRAMALEVRAPSSKSSAVDLMIGGYPTTQPWSQSDELLVTWMRRHSPHRHVAWYALGEPDQTSDRYDVMIAEQKESCLSFSPMPCKVMGVYRYWRGSQFRRGEPTWVGNHLESARPVATTGSSVKRISSGLVCLAISLTELPQVLPMLHAL